MWKILVLMLAFLFPMANQAKADLLDDRVRQYLARPGHKAFAQSVYNGFTWSAYNYRTLAEARQSAIKNCTLKGGRTCKILYENRRLIHPMKRKFVFNTDIVVYDKITNVKQGFSGKATVNNVYARMANFIIKINSGKTICSGKRIRKTSISGLYAVRCFGYSYSGGYKRNNGTIRGRVEYKGSWIDISIAEK